jgi:hypothetical protein
VDSGSCRLVPEGIIRLCQGRWDLKRGRGSARIYLQGIDALHLVQELTEDKLVGSGLFSGSFALGWDGRKVSIQGGHLYSLPGSGRLGIRDEVWLDKLLFYVRHGLQGQSYLFLLNERLELAFREFEYDFFSLRLLPKDKEVKARIELRGQGVRGDQPQQVGSLVFNVSGVQQALNQTLRWCREEEVQQTLERLLGPEP